MAKRKQTDPAQVIQAQPDPGSGVVEVLPEPQPLAVSVAVEKPSVPGLLNGTLDVVITSLQNDGWDLMAISGAIHQQVESQIQKRIEPVVLTDSQPA